MRWMSLGSNLFWPAAVCRRPGEITLCARGLDGDLVYRDWSRGHWSEVRSLGVPIARSGAVGPGMPVEWPLAACSSDVGRIHLFGRSPDGDLLHMTVHGEDWGNLERLGAPATTSDGTVVPLGLVTAPAACSREAGRIDVLAVGQTGELLHTEWDGSEWSGFESLGVLSLDFGDGRRSVPLSSAVAACADGPHRIAVFVRGSRGDLMWKRRDGQDWGDFVSLGWPQRPDEVYPALMVPAPLTGPPAACSWGSDRLDVFARGGSGEVLHTSWDGRQWSPFVSLGMPVSSDPEPEALASTGTIAACSWGPNRLDVFTRAVDGNLYHAWWDGSWTHP